MGGLMEQKVSAKDVRELTEQLKEMLGTDESTGEVLDNIVQLLALPDDKFEVLAPGVLQSFQQTLNNPTDKVALAQSFNAAGIRAEDLTSVFTEVTEEIDKSALTVQKRDFLKSLLLTIVNEVNDTEGIAKRNINVAIELCHPDAKIPQYAHISDSGVDVYAVEDITIVPEPP